MTDSLDYIRELARGYGQEWRDQAACTDADPDIFFPPRGQRADAARAICKKCPVRLECLAYALESQQPDGVWGGVLRPRVKKS